MVSPRISLLLALLVGPAACAAPAELRAPAIGAPAPAFTAKTLSDSAVALHDLLGKVVVVNLWATWCQPCRAELPQLEALHREFGAQGVAMIGVSVDGAGSGLDVRDFATEYGMTYAIWLDPDHQFALEFLTVGVPETFVIDRKGVIRWRQIGSIAPGDTTLAAAIRRAL